MDNIDGIVELQLENVRKRLENQRITLEIGEAVIGQLAIDGFDPIYGARPMKRLIQRNILDLLANEVVAGNIHDGDHVLVDLDDRLEYAINVTHS
ncbi:MAG: hypothetical protein LBH87_00890 [Coriobacteriales bacterium]|nr:hypothetical protein [Coriobacteriales bacterium]